MAAASRRRTAAAWLAVAALTAVPTAVNAVQALDRYHGLRSGWSWDLAYYNQWFWALARGDGKVTVSPISPYAEEGPSVWRTNYLAPVRVLLLPVYRLAPDPRTLLLIQAVVFWWVVPAAFTLVRSESGSDAAGLAAAALVPLTPLLWPLAWNDFRELQLALPFVVWAVQGVRSRHRGWAALGIGGMLACRQEFALMVATFALLPPREPEDAGRRLRWAHGLVFLGLAWFLFGFFGYLRYFQGEASTRNYVQQFLGGKPGFAQTLSTATVLLFAGMGAWGVLLWRVPRVALVALPWLWSLASGRWALRLLATEDWHHVRYAAPFAAVGLAAGLVGFARVAVDFRDRGWPRPARAGAWLAAAAASTLALVYVAQLASRQPLPVHPEDVEPFWRWAAEVKPDDGVMAAYEVTAPLSSRRTLFSYVLMVNRPRGWPTLPPGVGWVFYGRDDGMVELFEDQGFEAVHRGRVLTILRRAAARPE